MRQLSAHDAAFLFGDTRHSNANVSLVHIYNQSTAPGGKVRFKSILAQIESRLDRLPVLRQKLQRVPLDLDYPYWVDDENFDLEYHVRHIALPKPGDWRQFCIQVSRIHARPLATDRPLWEIYVIEGLDGFLDLPEGTFALVTKTHHAVVDVEGGSEITMLLHDLGPEANPPAPPAPWFPEPPPGRIATIRRGVLRSAGATLRLAGPIGRALREAAPAALTLAGDLLLRPRSGMPATRFNAVVSPHRVFETRRFRLDEFKEIRGLVQGATVNDAVLAVCGGALRRYLALHEELPAGGLTAMTPLYVRAEDAAPDAAPALSWIRVPLATEVDDPVQRLAAICAHHASSEVVARAVDARELTDLRRHVPAATLALTAKLLGRAAASTGRRAPLANCTITNVPGPSAPLYLCGARMTYMSAIMPIADGMGLVFAVTSYDGQVIVSPTSCRELMPDPATFAQCLRDSFQELLALARQPRRRKSPKAVPVAAEATAAAAPRRAVRPARPRSSSTGRRPSTTRLA
jgi:WS/DGAT/MGAT family acyltransferase